MFNVYPLLPDPDLQDLVDAGYSTSTSLLTDFDNFLNP